MKIDKEIKHPEYVEQLIEQFTESVLVLNSDFLIEKVFGSLFPSVFRSEYLGKYFPQFLNEAALSPELLFSASKQEWVISHKDFETFDHTVFPAEIRIVGIAGGGYLVFVKDISNDKLEKNATVKQTQAIESLSKSRKLREGKLDEAIYEILELASKATQTQRVNTWLIDEKHTEIRCIGNYDASINQLIAQSDLPRFAIPNYFSLYETEKIIVSDDTFNDGRMEELRDIYLKPHNIQAMMDIPIRIEGEIIGVICFEHVGCKRKWLLQEQKFGLVIAQMVSLAIETSDKHKMKFELEQAVKEQKILLQEVQHRVKNNLTIISSLLNLQSDKAKDDYHKALFQDFKNRLHSISSIHQMLYRSGSYTNINIGDYLKDFVKNLYSSFNNGETEVLITQKIQDDIELDISTSIQLSLIANEVLTNSFKHAFKDRKKGKLNISLSRKKSNIELIIKDDGPGFENKTFTHDSMGMDILEGLVDQIDGKFEYNGAKGAAFKLTFKQK